MKIGPGVDTTLLMQHLGDGLYLQRQPDGRVRVMGTNGEEPVPTGNNLRFDATVSGAAWSAAWPAEEAAPSKVRKGS